MTTIEVAAYKSREIHLPDDRELTITDVKQGSHRRALAASGPRYCRTLIGLICFADGAKNFPVLEN
jgi:hypothetical protein